MRRVSVSIPNDLLNELDRISRAAGVSRSEIIRQLLASRQALASDSVPEPTTEERLRILVESAGAWTDRTYSGEEFVEQLRSGRRLRELYEGGAPRAEEV